MKKVKNQYKLWDKTNKTFVAVSHGKSSWATLTGVENKLIELCTANRYSYYHNAHQNLKPRKTEEFEIQVYELVCREVKTYVLNGKKLEEVVTSREEVPAPLKISWETETWTEQEIHDFKTGK